MDPQDGPGWMWWPAGILGMWEHTYCYVLGFGDSLTHYTSFFGGVVPWADMSCHFLRFRGLGRMDGILRGFNKQLFYPTCTIMQTEARIKQHGTCPSHYHLTLPTFLIQELGSALVGNTVAWLQWHSVKDIGSKDSNQAKSLNRISYYRITNTSPWIRHHDIVTSWHHINHIQCVSFFSV